MFYSPKICAKKTQNGQVGVQVDSKSPNEKSGIMTSEALKSMASSQKHLQYDLTQTTEQSSNTERFSNMLKQTRNLSRR